LDCPNRAIAGYHAVFVFFPRAPPPLTPRVIARNEAIPAHANQKPLVFRND